MRLTAIAFAMLAVAPPARADDDTIVVTAERRAQPLSTLPSNAAALTAEDLARIGAQAPSEALNRLPGVAIHRGSGVESLPAIRSPVLTGGQGAGSFLILEDGVPIRAPGFANINELYETSLDFAERVEVTRGPGSALYGSNAVHGVVNVVTGPPPGATASAYVGSFGRYGGAATFVRTPLHPAATSDSTLIAGVSTAHEDGWRDNASLGEQHVLGGYEHNFGPWSLASRIAFVNLEQETAGFVDGTDAYKSKALSRSNANPEAFRNSQVLRAQAALSRDLGDGWSVQITPFARHIDTDLLMHFVPSKALEDTRQTGGGVQSAFYWDPSADFSLILGADIDRTTGSLREVQSRATQPGGYVKGLHYDYSVDATVLALYGQASWAFAPQWRLVAGVRGERTDYSYDNRTLANDVGRFRRPADRHDDFETLTPKLGVIWNFGELDRAAPAAPSLSGPGAPGGARSNPQSLWLNLSRGARAPQTTDLYELQTLQRPGDQKPETIDSAELGWRARFANGGRIEIAAYAMQKKNTSFRNADGFTVPFARTRHAGVELSGTLPLTAQLDLSGWASYAEHTYDFSDPVTRAGESIVKGTDIDTAPRRLANAQLTWRPTDALTAELGWTHMGQYFTNAANTRSYPGHDVIDLRTDWQVTPAFGLSFAVRNLADIRYAERADFAFGADRYFPAESRAVTLGLRATR